MDFRPLVVSVVLLAAGVARAQDPAAPAPAPAAGEAESMTGIGVGLGGLTFLGLGPALSAGNFAVYLPHQLASGLRLEGELGLALEVDGGSSALQLGFGAFRTRSVAAQVNTYLGGRLSFSRSDGGSFDVTSVRVAGVVGAEWAPVPRVALGVEGQLGLVYVDSDDGGDSTTGFSTAGLAILRVFLW